MIRVGWGYIAVLALIVLVVPLIAGRGWRGFLATLAVSTAYGGWYAWRYG